MTLTEAVPDRDGRIGHMLKHLEHMSEVLRAIGKSPPIDEPWANNGEMHMLAVEKALTVYFDEAGYGASTVFARLIDNKL